MSVLKVRLRIEGLNLARLLSQTHEKGIALENVVRADAFTLRVTCAKKDERALMSLCAERGYACARVRALRAYRAALFLRARPLMCAGLILTLLLAITATRFVFRVRVTGAGEYLGEVNAFLRENDIRAGLLKRDVDIESLRQTLEWRFPRVAWVRVTLRGLTLHIQVDKGAPPPDMPYRERAGDVTAACDGVIARLSVYAGTARVKAGDVVKKGQVLIEGVERGANDTPVPARARGEAMARVWESAQASVPAFDLVSAPTGNSARRVVYGAPGIERARGESPDYLAYDLERDMLPLVGAFVPVWIYRETYIEVSVEKAPRDEAVCREEALRAAERMLRANNPAADEMVDKWAVYSMIAGERLSCSVTAEYVRDIARFTPSDD